MTVPEELRQAIKTHFQAEDVKVESLAPDQPEQVFAYGQLPDSTIQGWFPIGDLDELEKKLKENGEL